MEILINPNVSYVLLVLGFMTAVLALFSPGTGILELGALGALLLAGYGIANLPINTWAFAVMILGIAPFAVAILRPKKGRSILVVIATLVFLLGAALLYRGETWLPAANPFVMILLSLIVLGTIWIMAAKGMEAASFQPAFDPDRLIGMTGQVSSDIRGEGTVYVNGEEWTAHSRVFIPSGKMVRVLQRDGLTIEVELVDHKLGHHEGLKNEHAKP